uniref:Uncharacterized protein n=1 Tax=Timema douglasi TaxID=61478 RepID=A0A7R8VHI6_TIMDO|nr:unnamed protein product [Timema douglasi]
MPYSCSPTCRTPDLPSWPSPSGPAPTGSPSATPVERPGRTPADKTPTLHQLSYPAQQPVIDREEPHPIYDDAGYEGELRLQATSPVPEECQDVGAELSRHALLYRPVVETQLLGALEQQEVVLGQARSRYTSSEPDDAIPHLGPRLVGSGLLHGALDKVQSEHVVVVHVVDCACVDHVTLTLLGTVLTGEDRRQTYVPLPERHKVHNDVSGRVLLYRWVQLLRDECNTVRAQCLVEYSHVHRGLQQRARQWVDATSMD